ncbi:MAG: UpxY family transcription antiterminator [Bacteroidales bacterium]|nr:UpxY family transcription antiterminator [Bacteroidales bacterium]
MRIARLFVGQAAAELYLPPPTHTFICNNGDSKLLQTHESSETKYWAALLVKINTEKSVARKLTELGIENFVPTQTEFHYWSDRRKKIERVVIPMVVFALVNKELEKEIVKFSFVYKFMSYPGRKDVAKIPTEQIDMLKLMLEKANSSVEISHSVQKIGEKIEIIRGPLKGLSGELCYFDREKTKVGVYVELLGYACVSVNKNYIKIRNY